MGHYHRGKFEHGSRCARLNYSDKFLNGTRIDTDHTDILFSQSGATSLLEQNKRIYQSKFCSLQRDKRHAYCDDCLGEDCEHFSSPENLKRVFRKKPIHKVEHLGKVVTV